MTSRPLALAIFVFCASLSVYAVQQLDRLNSTTIGAGSTVLASGTGAAAASPATEVTTDAVIITAGSLQTGDQVRITGLWKHVGTLTAPRVGLLFGGSTIITSSAGGATDTHFWMTATVAITGSATQESFGTVMRPNGAFIGTTAASLTLTSANAITIAFRANFNVAQADTIQLVGYSVERLRP